jgi:hypothetical protein
VIKEKDKAKANEPRPVTMLLSDGCIEDMTSLLFTSVVSNLSTIVGYNIDGEPLPAPRPLSVLEKMRNWVDPYGLLCIKCTSSVNIIFRVRLKCAKDTIDYVIKTIITALLSSPLQTHTSHRHTHEHTHTYVYNPLQTSLSLSQPWRTTPQHTPTAKCLGDTSVHGQLVVRGLAWAQHINEPWKILVYAGAYIIFSVGFDITIIALLGDAVLAIGES